ncbi:uncharacterized protein LOC120777164 [Bactrocera tryoni]|uniref:uncharacterized protein LOC120777164 n=1 Tax=Bactrocera tryoni TaxID=59916 RepID=UPI001A997026|nr:uncharacterized protein LOC120777164 [Bactrocera tryoni]
MCKVKKECERSSVRYESLSEFARADGEDGEAAAAALHSTPEDSFSFLCTQIINKTDVMAHHKIVRETKVLVKKVQQTVCRISGESCEDFHTELAVLMPMQTLDAFFDLEEKILEKNYEDAVITYLFTLKGTSGDIGEVMKRVFGDEVLSLFNWDGRCGKKSLSELKIVSIGSIVKFSNCMDASTSKRKSERALSKATTGKNAIC